MVCKPIGHVESMHTDPSKTPIQPVFAKGCEGRVIVLPEYEEGLQDLEGFSHIIVVYHMHRAGPPKLKVKPFLQDVERGVFATRSPRRPNPIGFSVVCLKRREGCTLFIEDVDMLDSTPVLDIKPFIGRFDYREDAVSGWQDDVDDRTASEKGLRGYKK